MMQVVGQILGHDQMLFCFEGMGISTVEAFLVASKIEKKWGEPKAEPILGFHFQTWIATGNCRKLWENLLLENLLLEHSLGDLSQVSLSVTSQRSPSEFGVEQDSGPLASLCSMLIYVC